MSALRGGTLAREFYEQVAGPILLARWPGLPHAAGRLGSGSDVLGLDDEMSRDHDWGLRLTLLVDDDHVAPVDEHLARELPETFHGLPTRFATSWHPQPRHQVEVATPDEFVRSRLGVTARHPLSALDWLSLTGMSVLEVTAGPVFADTAGEISLARRRLSWYPDDVWYYVVAAAWSRVGQELPFVGRTGVRGDDLGSRVLAARLTGTLLHLGFLLERRWPPYPKWLGTLFAQLPAASAAQPMLQAALAAPDWPERESALCDAISCLHEVQRATGLPTGPQVLEAFWDRPFRGLRASVSRMLTDAITDPEVAALPEGAGSVQQWIDNVDVLTPPERRRQAAMAWRHPAG